jgi:hypothetical protein
MRPTPLLVSALAVSALLALPFAARAQAPGAASAAPDLGTPAPATAPAPAPASFAGQPIDVSPPPEVKAAAQQRKHGIFPLWGDAVRAKGFDLPNPYSVMVNYYYQDSNLDIGNLKLGLNGGPMQDFSGVIQIPDANAHASALAVRPAIMVFPFLSFYGVFSSGATETKVHVVSPVFPAVDFNTTAKSGAQVLTLGATFQMAYRGIFGVADFNWAVSDVERLADLVGANMLSFRLGRAWTLNAQGRKLALWAGTAGQVIDVETKGSVRLGAVLPPGAIDGSRCATLPPGRLQDQCLALANGVANAANDATVQYKLDKKPEHVWNYLAGAQFALDRSWAFRTEASFLNGRTSFLLGTEYSFDIY